MRRLAVAALALALFGPALWGQDDKNKPKTDTPEAEYKGLLAELQKIGQEAGKNFRAATNEEAKRRIREDYDKQRTAFAGRFMALAQKHPKDPAAVDALLLVLNIGSEPDQERALTVLMTDHIQGETLGQKAESLAQSGAPGAEKLLRAILAKSPHKEAQAKAAFGLAQQFKERADEPGLKPDQAQKLSKEAEDLFETVVQKYAHIMGSRKEPLGATAKRQLFELRNLSLGKVAPDIEGDDLDGKKFKLSDYRGKVVVLDFWGHW